MGTNLQDPVKSDVGLKQQLDTGGAFLKDVHHKIFPPHEKSHEPDIRDRLWDESRANNKLAAWVDRNIRSHLAK